MTSDSHLFRMSEQLKADGWTLTDNRFHKDNQVYLPLYEAKMVGFYDHRAADVVISATAMVRQGQPSELGSAEHTNPYRQTVPCSWVPKTEVESRLQGRWAHACLLGWRDITIATN